MTKLPIGPFSQIRSRMSLMLRQILWIITMDINKKDVAKPILIKVTFEKDFKEYRKT